MRPNKVDLISAGGLGDATILDHSNFGGGDRLALDFVSRANNLLRTFPFDRGDRGILEQSLRRARILSVRELRHCDSQEAVRDQERMLAFSCPGLIQLKIDSGVANEDSWEKAMREHRALNVFVAHELFVASGRQQGNLPLDHNYNLSSTKYGLDNWASAALGSRIPPPPLEPVGPGPGIPLFPLN